MSQSTAISPPPNDKVIGHTDGSPQPDDQPNPSNKGEKAGCQPPLKDKQKEVDSTVISPPPDSKVIGHTDNSPQPDDQPEPSNRRKKAGRQSPLTDEQKEVVDAYIPAWEALLTKLKLHLGKEGRGRDEEEVTGWVSTTLEKILETPEFSSKTVLRTKSDWKKVGKLYRDCYPIFLFSHP